MTSATASTHPDHPTASEPSMVWWQGALMTLKAHRGSTGGALGLVEARFPAGFGPPLHVHHREDEALYVLDGQLRCRRGDTEFTAGPGELIFGPRELPHTFKAGPGGARALVLMTQRAWSRCSRRAACRRLIPPPHPSRTTTSSS
jgi:quercetin dioxygenase-like cupin family protein